MTVIRSDVLKELLMGICEVTYMDPYSVEYKISATLSENHIDGSVHENKYDKSVVMWNLVDEEWQTIPLENIVDVERLTGRGMKKKQMNMDDILKLLS